MKKKIDHLAEYQLEILFDYFLALFPPNPSWLEMLFCPPVPPTFDELVTDDVWNQAVATVEDLELD